MTNARMVGLMVLVAACSGDDDPATLPPDGGDGSAECNAPTGTFHGQSLANGDGKEDRYYWLHVPASYHCQPVPLLVDFHGTAEDMPEEAYQTDALIELSDARDVIVVRPRSRSSTEGNYTIYRWDQNPGDLARNVTFAKKLVADLEQRYTIDTARVYASGFSSGSNMTTQFLLDATSPFKGLAPIAGGKWTDEPLPPLASGPRMYFATGYRDYLWPYARDTAIAVTAAGLPADRVFVRRSGGGHDLYAWHFDELWQFLDAGTPLGGGAIGAPWTASSLPSPADVLALARDGSTLVAAGARGRTWRRDATGTWALDLDRGTADYTALCFNGTRGFVGGDYTAVHRTGTTWGADQHVPDFGMQLGQGWVNAAVCPSDGSVVVAGYWSAASTSDAGAHWSKLGIDVGGYDAQVAGATSTAGATVLVGYYNYVGTAAAGSMAATAAQSPSEVDWWNATAAVGASVWAVGDGGAIARSNDIGATWAAQSSGTVENLYGVAFADASYGVAVGRRGAVVITTDGGAHWSPRPLGKDIFLGAVAIDATTITVAGEDGVIATSPR